MSANATQPQQTTTASSNSVPFALKPLNGMVGKGFTTTVTANPFALGQQQGIVPVVTPVAVKVSAAEAETKSETPFPLVQNTVLLTATATKTQPVVTGIVPRSLNQHHVPIAFGMLPPPKTAKQNEKFLCQLESTLKTVHRHQHNTQKRKQVFMVLMGILLTSGVVAGVGQLLMPVNPQALAKTAVGGNHGLLPELTASATNIPKAAVTATVTSDVIVTSLDPIPELDQPPDSAVDDTLSFPEPTTHQSATSTTVVTKTTQSTSVKKEASHVVDLFEDTTPVPTLELPAQKKRQSVQQALANLPAYTPKQAALIEDLMSNGTDKHHHHGGESGTVSHPWWKPRNGFNFKNPLSHMSISSHFGHRWGRMHRGIDLQAPHGVNIYAANGGRVIYSGWESGYGNLVIIDHGNGVRTKYAHCSKLSVSVGDVVEQGQRIAKVGSTGHSTGPHLHFEVVVNGKARNPIAYL
jgi:murein DD-endopeptidase MepM/ murein hydrolase activator NlpD